MQLRLTVSPRTLDRMAAVTIALLALAHVVMQWLLFFGGADRESLVVRQFSLEAEGNIPSSFAGLQWGAAAAMLALIGSTRRLEGDRMAPYWTGLAVLFAALTIDELASFHELLIRPTRELLPGITTGLFYWAWVLPGMALVAVVGLLYLRFVFRYLPATTRNCTILGGLLFLTGAVGIEMPEAAWVERNGWDNFEYGLFVLVEEVFEMTGLAVFLSGLTRYFRAYVGSVAFYLHGPLSVDGHPTQPAAYRLGLPWRALLPGSLAAIVLLAAGHLATQWLEHRQGYDSVYGLVPRFDMAEHANLPTVFSTLQLLVAGGLVGAVACARSRAGDRFAGVWTVFAVGLVVLGVDEMTQFSDVLAQWLGSVVPGIGGEALTLAVLALALLVSTVSAGWRDRSPETAAGPAILLLIVLGTGLLLGAAALVDLFRESRDAQTASDPFVGSVLVMVEEVLEMVGVLLVTIAGLREMHRWVDEVRLGAPDPAMATDPGLTDPPSAHTLRPARRGPRSGRTPRARDPASSRETGSPRSG
jgi:hypothetical protein